VDRLHFAHPAIHGLLHLAMEIPRIGPPTLYSAWTMERTIGNLKEEVRLHSSPFVNIAERGLQCSQKNALKAMIPSLQTEKPYVPKGAVDIGN
ncbi:hypothetical protein K439DRAFT_1281183, partial [Ramaria rubella]